jgi:lipopolysaccharide transport system ATP-binding protein
MSSVSIEVENLSKQYRLGLVGTGTLSHDLNRWWHTIRGKDDPYLKVGEENNRATAGESKYVWAIKDINFSVNKGEVLGIIGKNGAGKSTLLKLLSRVTSPTVGQIKIKGRIASLLEVGTGFHPELTGKDNIFLNGAILGMTKREINDKLDEIIEFSGTARYIDTPVKRYSSGMRVRLAFAVAAHLEPEILIVDEVLAVGDAEFQKKAIGKMQDVAKGGGRTVLFVSHNMAAVKSLCTRAVLLENGKLTMNSDVDSVVSRYLSGDTGRANYSKFSDAVEANIVLEEISVSNSHRSVDEVIFIDQEIKIETSILLRENDKLDVTLHVKDDQGQVIFTTSSIRSKTELSEVKSAGSNLFSCKFPANFFNSGTFYVDIYFVRNKKKSVAKVMDAVAFTVGENSRAIGQWMGKTPGALKPHFDWSIKNFETLK